MSVPRSQIRYLIPAAVLAVVAVVAVLLTVVRGIQSHRLELARTAAVRDMAIQLESSLWPSMQRYRLLRVRDVDGDRVGECGSVSEVLAADLLDHRWQRTADGLVRYGPYAVRAQLAEGPEPAEHPCVVLAFPVDDIALPALLLDESGRILVGPQDYQPGTVIERAAWQVLWDRSAPPADLTAPAGS